MLMFNVPQTLLWIGNYQSRRFSSDELEVWLASRGFEGSQIEASITTVFSIFRKGISFPCANTQRDIPESLRLAIVDPATAIFQGAHDELLKNLVNGKIAMRGRKVREPETFRLENGAWGSVEYRPGCGPPIPLEVIPAASFGELRFIDREGVEAAPVPGESVISDEEVAALHAANSKSEPDGLAELLAEEAKLKGEFAELAEQRDRVRAFASEEAEILGQMNALSAREVEAIQAWAKNPQGTPPSPLTAERATLAERLAEVSHAARAAGLAADQIEAAQREIHAKQLALEPQIVAEVVNRIEAEYADALEELRVDIEAVNRGFAQVLGFREMLAEQGRHLFGSGHESEGRFLVSRLEKLPAPDPQSLGTTAAEIAAAAALWRQRADKLRGLT